jgi:hypothetical protein
MAGRMQRLICKLALNAPIDEWFPQEAMDSIIEMDVGLEKLSGIASLISDEAVPTPLRGDLRKGDLLCEVTNSDGTTSTKYGGKEILFKEFITPRLPMLAYFLGGIADRTKKMAEEAETGQRLNERSNISPTTIFIRTLYQDFWFREFGGRLDETFAKLCSVVLVENPISGDTVRTALRGCA